MRSKEECGCTHDGAHWTHRCEGHLTSDAATHAVWQEDYYRTTRPDPARKRVAAPLDDWLA